MRSKWQTVAQAAVLAAAVLAATVFLVHIPIGATGGYIHLGDTFVYLAAALLPTPLAMAAAAIGGGLADILTGAAIWAPATVIIKALMVLPFSHRGQPLCTRKNAGATVASGLILVAGYYIAECVILGSFAAPLISVIPNAVQATANGAAFLAVAAMLDKSGATRFLG